MVKTLGTKEAAHHSSALAQTDLGNTFLINLAQLMGAVA